MRIVFVALIGLVCNPLVQAEAAQPQHRDGRQRTLPPEALQAQRQAQMQAAQVQGRMQAMQQFIDREEQMLNRRLQYAQQIRQKGLPGNDMKMLKRAEQIERQAIATYEARVKQFEQYRASDGQPAVQPTATQPGATATQPRATTTQPRATATQPRATATQQSGTTWTQARPNPAQLAAQNAAAQRAATQRAAAQKAAAQRVAAQKAAAQKAASKSKSPWNIFRRGR